MNKMFQTLWLALALVSLCLLRPVTLTAGGAPGAPGSPSFWTYAGKTGIGTSYEARACENRSAGISPWDAQ